MAIALFRRFIKITHYKWDVFTSQSKITDIQDFQKYGIVSWMGLALVMWNSNNLKRDNFIIKPYIHIHVRLVGVNRSFPRPMSLVLLV